MRWPILLILYSDDLNPNGPRRECWVAYWYLSKVFPFSEKDKQKFVDKFIGISRVHLGCSKEGTIKYLLHQAEYTLMICKKYMKLKNLTTLRKFLTPLDENEDSMPDREEPGQEAGVGRMFVGDFLFIGLWKGPDMPPRI